jgi:hypothetical protein
LSTQRANPAPDFTAPIYAFATGMDANGNPQMVPGQHNIIDELPGDPGYSPFWDVNLVIVPTSYQANSITSVAQIKESGFQVLHPGKVVNCPVVRTDQAVTGNTGSVMAGTQPGAATPGMPQTGGGTQDEDLAIWAALAAAALIAGSATLFVSRERAKAHDR